MTHCHCCGSAIDTSDWYPIVTAKDERGNVALYAFCDKQCRETWRAQTAD
ncbi:hypothetical protein ACFR9U_02240 [Halorientalis brevis]|uniref:MYM-type domain-containing protein n=1 Tax=Halorientalis brevis TaxID=1126241 RepID=A0ABD6C8R8_9EURY|nr:hypothetical protein [Halorientalis brevis]